MQRAPSIPETLFVLLASLTGIFSVVMTVILAIQFCVLRDFATRKSIYLIVTACGVAQALSIFLSPRLEQIGVNKNIIAWFHAGWMLIAFGAKNAVVWSAGTLYLVKWVKNGHSRDNRILRLSPLFAMVTAAFMFLVGALAEGDWGLFELSPIDMSRDISSFHTHWCSMQLSYARRKTKGCKPALHVWSVLYVDFLS